MTKLTCIALCAMSLAGCARQKDNAASPHADTAKTDRPDNAQHPAPESVLVSVNGKDMTFGEADRRVRGQLASLRAQIPEDKMPLVYQRLMDEIKKQFVTRTLLLAEADARGISASPEDEQQALQRIQARLPDGVNVSEFMTNSPLGETYMRDELLAGIRINKLLTEYSEGKVDITEEEVAAYRQKHASTLTLPESVRARHILIAVDPNDDAAAKAAKRETAERVRNQLLEGADFAQLAMEHSSCPSKKRGGDLGQFERGRMVKPFDDAAFAQEVGKIGDVVETRFGYHIIEVTDHQPETTLDDNAIRDVIRNDKTKLLVEAYLDELKAKADVKYY